MSFYLRAFRLGNVAIDEALGDLHDLIEETGAGFLILPLREFYILCGGGLEGEQIPIIESAIEKVGVFEEFTPSEADLAVIRELVSQKIAFLKFSLTELGKLQAKIKQIDRTS